MTTEQINAAIKKVMDDCDTRMDLYRSTSLRASLERQELQQAEIQEVIEAVADAGFWYCLDTTIAHRKPHGVTGDGEGEKPPWVATVWGPDQLKSRLQSVYPIR